MAFVDKYAGVTLDWYDDKGETLKAKFPTLDSLPETIKQASIEPKEKLANEAFALVAIDGGNVLRKYACTDPGTTAMSVIYFMEHGDKLPLEAQKLAAANLVEACQYFEMKPPQAIEKLAFLSPFAKSLLAGAVGGGATGALGGAQADEDHLRGALRGGALGAITGAGTVGLMSPSELTSRQLGSLGALHGYGAGRLASGEEKKASAEEDTADLMLDKALKEHEAHETAPEEMEEQRSGFEIHPDAASPGPEPAFKLAFGWQGAARLGGIAGLGAASGAIGAGEGHRLRGALAGLPAGVLGGTAGGIGGVAAADALGIHHRLPADAGGAIGALGTGLAAGRLVRPKTPIDITGQSAPTKLASLPSSLDEYAVVVGGRGFYPIDSWDNIKLASDYWLTNKLQMEPELRHQYATKLASRARSLGYILPAEIQEAGTGTYASPEHLREALDMRKVAFPRRSEERRFLEDLFEKRAEMDPSIYAECLRRFDIEQGLAHGWDQAVLDPWASTFGKEADTVVWAEGLDRVTASELHNLALNHSGGLREKFTTGFVDEFEKDPIGFFNALPLPQKKIFARLADDMAHSGGSEGTHITADKTPEAKKSIGALG